MKRNLKIAILGSRGVPAKYGGFESFTERVSENLVKMGIDVTVFCPSKKDNKKYVYHGINLRFVPDLERFSGSLGTLLYDIFSLLRASLSDFRIIYMLGYSSAWFCLFPRFFGKKVIINTDGLEWKRSKWSIPIRRYLKLNEYLSTKFANALISDSMAIKKYFNKNYGKDSTFITNGSGVFFSRNKKILKKYGLRPFDYYLVVARLEPENHIDTIIKGFSLTKSKKRLILITNIKPTKYFKEIQELCKKDNRITLFGPLYNLEELNEIRSNAFAYIHGHSVGGTNPSLLESMGCGSTVIAFNVQFNVEVLRSNKFLFENEDELEKSIEKLEKMEKEKIKEIGRKNRKIIDEYYNWDKISKEYFKFFTQL